MRYYIYISLIAVLSVLCFNNAMGQARTRFGGQGGATDSAFTMNQLLLKAYATATPNMFLKMTSTGHVVLAVPAGSGGGLVDSVTISNDSLFYWGGGVSFFVGIVNSGGSIDTTGLSDRIAYNLTRIDGLSDTASLHADTLEAHKDWLSSIESEVANTTWQDVLDVGRVGDSALVDSNLYIGTTAERKPISIQVAGDSRDAVSEVPLSKIWPGRLANYLGATLDNRLAVSGSFLMNQTPRYNPLNDTGALMDIITTPGKIRNVTGLTDSVYYFIVTRGINDLHWYTMYDSGYNYTPENYGLALRTAMDSLTNWGYQVILMGPKYVKPTSTHVVQDSVFRWIDTAKQIAADYNVPFFNAFTWQQSHGAANLLSFVDGFHENTEGHEVLFTGMLHTMGYDVERNDQELAVNGTAEFNSLKLRTPDTITTGAVPAFFNSTGNLVPGANELIRNNSTSNMPQGANINVADTIRGSLISSRGFGGTSFRAANNTSAIRGDAATNGTIYFDPSADGTGSLVFRSLPNQLSLSSTELFTGLVMRSNIMRAATAFQGSAASNGTLYVDASQNTTGTLNIRAGSTTTFTSAGVQALALNVNNTFALNSGGFITEYGNASITNGLIPIGNTTSGRLEMGTITAGSGISVTNGTGSITLAVTGKVDSVTKSNDSFFYYKGAVRTFIGLDNSGSGSGIDSVRISGDTLYQCSSGTCTFVGLVNSGGGGSGTVTSFTFTDGNGFDGTVTNSTTTPALSITLQADHNLVSDAQLAAIGSLATDYVSLSGSYSNPTWITALAWSKITGTPTTLSGYGITNAVVNTTTVNGQALSSNVTLDIDDVAPTQTGNANKILTTDGTNATWQAPAVGVTINTQSGTTYTLLSSDNGKVVEFTNSSAVTVTVPTGLGTTFTCIIRQNGTGDVTLSASGTTINNANSHTSTRAQYSAFAIIATSTANTFITQGDMD